MPTHEMGEMMAELNLREHRLEKQNLLLLKPFSIHKRPSTRGYSKSIKSMSSAVYVIMCRLKAGKYENQGFKLKKDELINIIVEEIIAGNKNTCSGNYIQQACPYR